MSAFNEDTPFVVGFKIKFLAFADAIKGYGDCDLYADKIRLWDFGKILNLFIEVTAPTKRGFQVLNHGDLWVNNLMFKSDAAGNLEVSFIDYQTSFWASPANDLIQLLISSVADDIKTEYFDDFVEFYHEQLLGSLNKLKYGEKNVPTLGELHLDLFDKGGCGRENSSNPIIFSLKSSLYSVFLHNVQSLCCQVRFTGRNRHGNDVDRQERPSNV